MEILALDPQPESKGVTTFLCEECNPTPVKLSTTDRALVACVIGGVCFLLLAGAMHLWGPGFQLAALLPSAGLTWYTWKRVKVIREQALTKPPVSDEPRQAPDLALRYVDMANKTLFSWATLVAVAHSGAAAVLAPLFLSKPSSADLTTIGGGIVLLGFLCYAAVHANEAAWSRAQNAVHWARHNGSLAPFFRYVHTNNDGRKSQEIVQAMLDRAAFTWMYIGTCLMVPSFLSWMLTPR